MWIVISNFGKNDNITILNLFILFEIYGNLLTLFKDKTMDEKLMFKVHPDYTEHNVVPFCRLKLMFKKFIHNCFGPIN